MVDGSSPPVLPTPSSCPPVIQISSSGLGVGGGEGKGGDVGRRVEGGGEVGRRRSGRERSRWGDGGEDAARSRSRSDGQNSWSILSQEIRQQFGPFIFLVVIVAGFLGVHFVFNRRREAVSCRSGAGRL